MQTSLPAGKLPAPLLTKLLDRLPISHPQLIVGPAVGEDAALIEFAPININLLAAKSDPITFATDEIGYYAVNVCANDLAVMGARPRYYLPTILFPAGTTDDGLAVRIFAQIGEACRAINVVIAGGHSEITPAVNQVVVAGTMLGEVRRERHYTSRGCESGNVVLLAGATPIEGTSLIAREKRQELLARGWNEIDLEDAAHFLYSPGISIMRPALLAGDRKLVTAMHDPTEGGIATALAELATASNVGLEIDLDMIHIPTLSRRLCAEFGLDPLGTIASGALLATAPQENVTELIRLWQEIGWPASVIGRVTASRHGLVARKNGQIVPFPSFQRDEITKLT